MEPTDDSSLHDRVAALEAKVAALQQQLGDMRGQPAIRPAPEPAPVLPSPPPPLPPHQPALRPARQAKRVASNRVPSALKSEDWLSKIGIGLLLFGLVFLFKYSIDQGWVTPLVRVGFGAVLGAFLLGTGLQLRPKRRRLGQVLLGGSVATFYTTIFAAFQFYDMLLYPVALAAMGAVTVLTFVLAVQQDDPVLAVIATLGGLGTPFLLYTGASSMPGLVAYTCIVLAGAAGIYMYKGWRSLLWTAVLGGWIVFAAAFVDLAFDGANAWRDEVAFQLGVVFCWLVFGVLPVVREVVHRRAPDRWAVPPLAWFKGTAFIERPALMVAVAAPLVTLMFLYEFLDMQDVVRGLLVAGVAGLYGGAYAWLRRAGLPVLAGAHGVAAALLLMPAVFDLFDSATLKVAALAVEACLLHVLARAFTDRALRFVGHLLSVVVALWVAVRMLDGGAEVPVLIHPRSLVDLGILALLFGAAWTMKSRPLSVVYGLAAYIGLLGWFWRDLVALPNGQAYVSVTWGLTALLLLALGWRYDADLLRTTGLATLLIVVGKLFVVDLAKLEAVWRILLFLGFGGVLLLLSYFFPSLWRPKNETKEPSVEAEETVAGG